MGNDENLQSHLRASGENHVRSNRSRRQAIAAGSRSIPRGEAHSEGAMSAPMNSVPRFLLILPAVVIVVAAAEGIYLQQVRRQLYDWGAYFPSLGDPIGPLVIHRIM